MKSGQYRWMALMVGCCWLAGIYSYGLHAASVDPPLIAKDTGLLRKPALIITSNYYCSKFVRHTPKLTNRTGQLVQGGEIGFHLQTFGKRDWQVFHRFPALGASAIWLHPGAGAHGNLIGVFPHLTIPLMRFGRSGIFFRVGSGIGWATRPYNAFTNATENALGVHWNNVTQFRLGGECAVIPHWRASFGVVLTHFSNGGYALPNFGMNIPGGFAGIVYAPHFSGKSDLPKLLVQKRPTRRWGTTLQAGMARIEYVSVDGPKYAVWILSGAITFKVHKFNRLALGMDWEKNNGVKAWLLNNTLLPGGRSAADKGAQRTGVFLADEFFFGRLGIYIQASCHVGDEPRNSLALSRNYNKLGFRYYFPVAPISPTKIYLGISLKAYKGVAECIAFHSGIDF
jgi:hypothetical protein